MKAREVAALTAMAAMLVPAGTAHAASHDEGLPNIDVRERASAPVPARTRDARRSLERRLGAGGDVRTDDVSGGVAFVGRTDDLLTGPSDDPATRIALDYVRDHGEIFGLGKDDVENLELVDRVTSPDGITHLRFNQVLDGVESYDSGLDAHVTADGQLINVSGAPVPGAELPGGSPALTAQGGLGAARVAARGSALAPRVDKVEDGVMSFATGETAERRWAATADGPQLVWNVIVDGGDGHGYDVLVDASDGDLVARFDLTHSLGQAQYFERDPEVTPTPETITMPAAWYDDHNGGTRLWGTFARTYLDPGDQDPGGGFELGGSRVQVPASSGGPDSPDWLYTQSHTFPGATPCPPLTGCTWDSAAPSSATTNQLQAATNAHVLTNRFHDYLAQAPIGFDVASGNFERSVAVGVAVGIGDDYVQAEINDGEGLNNANFFTPPDGRPGRMQMYLFDSFDVNGSDVADIVYHEYGHGLSNRLVVNAAGTGALTSFQGRMMGEAWSDFYALDLLGSEGNLPDTAAPGEVRTGTYVRAGGIRAKAADCPVNAAGGDAGCDGNGTATVVLGGYTYGDLAATNNASPHNGGEVWTETLWDMRRSTIPRTAVLALVTGGMRLSADRPSMLDMRDAILQQAVAMRSAPGAGDDYTDELWAIFANRGMGIGAVSPTPDSTAVTQSTALPTNQFRAGDARLRDPYPGGDNDGVIESGERFEIDQTVRSFGISDPLTTPTATMIAGAGATVADGSATWPALGRGTQGVNSDPLAGQVGASCASKIPMNLTITTASGTLTPVVFVDPRPGSSQRIALNDAFYGAVPTAGVTEATFTLPADAGLVTDVDLRIDELRHPWVGDLRIDLLHGAQVATLVNRAGSGGNVGNYGGDDIIDAVFSDDGTATGTLPASGPVTGRFINAAMASFENTQAGGIWTLKISDFSIGDTGYLAKWGLTGPQVPCGRAEIPAAATGGASGVAQGAATIGGSVTPNGRATGLRFSYGTSTAYGTSTPVVDVGAGDGAVDRTAALGGLAPGTTYHYRVEAIREGGQVAVAGADQAFTTAAAPGPAPGPGPAPAVVVPPVLRPPTPSASLSISGLKVTLGKARTKSRKRATVELRLSRAARVTIALTRSVKGTRAGSRCGPRKKRGRSCTRQVAAGAPVTKQLAAGAQKVALAAAGLRKGKYTVTVSAPGVNRPATLSFAVR